MNGFIKVSNNIKKSWLFNKPNELTWYIHMYLMANFKDNYMMFNGKNLLIKRGQFLSSYRKLSENLPQCTVRKLRTFISKCEKHKILEVKKLGSATLFNIVDYDAAIESNTTTYMQSQKNDTVNDTQNDTQNDTAKNYIKTRKSTTYDKAKTKNDTQNDTVNDTQNDNNRRKIKKDKKKNNKDVFLFSLTEKDFENEKEKQYFKTTLAFYELFQKNLEELGIKSNQIKKTKAENIKYIRLIVEKDKYSFEDLREVWGYLNTNEFWKKNIRSANKLREKFETLLVNSRSEKKKKVAQKKKNPYEVTEQEYVNTIEAIKKGIESAGLFKN